MMAEQLAIPGVFRGKMLEWSVGKARTGATLFKARIQTTERFDFDSQKWQEFSEGEITAFLTLFSKGKTLSWADNLAKALNYDGTVDFTEFLNSEDFSNVVVQLRVDFDEYKGQERLRVNDILPHDAPLQGFSKLSADAVKTLANENKIVIEGVTKPEVAASVAPVIADSDIPF